jgi:hypothetical protein
MWISRSTVWRGGVALAAALVSGVSGASAQAPGVACRATLAGTYFATIRTEAGAFASRALVTIHADGTLLIADSRQHQGLHGSSFSAQQGGYRCTGARTAQAVVLNFGFPPQEGIARSEWSLAYDPANGVLRGTITLTIFVGVEGVDPFALGGKPMGVFAFGALRVAPRAK